MTTATGELPGQLVLAGIIQEPAPTKLAALAAADASAKKALKPGKTPKARTMLALLRQALSVAEEAETRGFKLQLPLHDHDLERVVLQLRSAVARLWLPPKHDGRLPSDVIEALGSSIPDRRFDPAEPHRVAHVCRLIHCDDVPSRFTTEWRTKREEIFEGRKTCAGIAAAIAARVKEAKGVAARLRRKGVDTEVDQYGDLTIPRDFNPFNNVRIGEPFAQDVSREVLAIELGGYSVDDDAIFVRFGEQLDGLEYPKPYRDNDRYHFVEQLDTEPEVMCDLYYADGVFALITTRQYPLVVGERAQRCQIPYGHRFIDENGQERVDEYDSHEFTRKSLWVTYLGEAPKKRPSAKRSSRKKKATTRTRRRKGASATSTSTEAQ